MKKWVFVILLIFSLFLFSCKNDEKDNGKVDDEINTTDEKDDKKEENNEDDEPLPEKGNDEEPVKKELIFSETCLYDLASSENLSVEIQNLAKIDSLKVADIEIKDYEISDNKLTIKKEYLENIGYKSIVCEFTSEDITYMFNIRIMDSREPNLNDSNEKTYVGDDICFEFNLYDGKIDNVKYNNEDLCVDCYKVEGNKLIISKSYIINTASGNNVFQYQISYYVYNEPNKIYYSKGEVSIINQKSLEFKIEDFNNGIGITEKKSTGKKEFSKSNSSEFFNMIDDFNYAIYNFDANTTILYSISFNGNIINVYDDYLFTYNGTMYKLIRGSFIFLQNYSYTINSGDLPWI